MVIVGVTYMASANTGACIIVDGKLIAFAEEERFIRVKHAPNYYPLHSINYCLDVAGLTIDQVDYIAVGHSEVRTHSEIWKDPHFKNQGEIVDFEDGNHDYFYDVLNGWVINDLNQYKLPKTYWGIDTIDKVKFYPHNDCHAASAVIPSKFGPTNYLSADGFGDNNAGVYGFFDGEEFHQYGYIHPFRTIGGFYSYVTEFLGFQQHSAEGKTMGLACYGNVDKNLLPEFSEVNEKGIKECLTKEYGKYFNSIRDTELHNEVRENILSETAVNMAATAQHYFEEYIFSYAEYLYNQTGNTNLAVAGGCMLNCTTNGKLLQKDYVDRLFVQPASADSGTALGAAILCYKEMVGEWPDIDFNTAYWGSEFTDEEIRRTLNENGLEYRRVEPSSEIAKLINENKVIGYFNGRAEVGPRALCHRSILANPTIAENLDRVNVIKNREFWRPLAPVMMEEYFHKIVEAKHKSPFMLMACEVKEDWRDKIPATTHVDNSCRPQSINRSQNQVIHSALSKFKEMSGVPVFMNTSFNVAGEPLVDSPQDAINTFLNCGLDALILGNYCVIK